MTFAIQDSGLLILLVVRTNLWRRFMKKIVILADHSEAKDDLIAILTGLFPDCGISIVSAPQEKDKLRVLNEVIDPDGIFLIEAVFTADP